MGIIYVLGKWLQDTGIYEDMIDHHSYAPSFYSNYRGHGLESTAMINHVFISFSAVKIYDLSYIHFYTKID